MKKLFATLCGLMVTAALILLGPHRVQLSDDQTGDAELAAFIHDHAPQGAHNVTGFVIAGDKPTFARLGADANTEIEIGSITKTFNAELLRQAVARGDVSLDTRVSEIIDTQGAPIGEATLASLANHEAGLPRNPGLDPLASITERNPYLDVSRQDIFDMALAAKLKNQGTQTYSNLGAALLGQLLAEKAGKPWEELVRESIFVPLEMTDSYVAVPGTASDAPQGFNQRGRLTANWEMDGYAPAGAIRSTPADMAKFTTHVMTHGVPEYTWKQEEEYISHNGGTGGFRSMLVFDPAGKQAAFVNTDSSVWVNQLGKDMLSWKP
ncbi:serine hydrolase domain-containing protein [Corynebacterium sp. H128]|uniref:serine hydrolase domain-containing protein n=1 Tax=Corynebacterium sp. H128 TaxID=3133427 RepID=UPI0030B3C479